MKLQNNWLGRAALVGAAALAVVAAASAQQGRTTYVLTSTNDAQANAVKVFRVQSEGAAALPLVNTLPTGGQGGASGNAGILEFSGEFGAVANFGSNSVSQLVRLGNFIGLGRTVPLAEGCTQPVSVALKGHHLFVVGANCAESRGWPAGFEGRSQVVKIPDASAAQIAVGENWAAVTLKSGSLLQLPLTRDQGGLSGEVTNIPLPADANNTPFGEAFWGNLLGFTPAHSAKSFAVVDAEHQVFPILGPQPAAPANAPCWVAKGPGSVWYTANSPGMAIAEFFSDDRGGVLYKQVPLPGVPTDITVSPDQKWLAVIYTDASNQARIGVFSIDAFGNLTPFATTDPVAGVAAFNGVAFSQ